MIETSRIVRDDGQTSVLYDTGVEIRFSLNHCETPDTLTFRVHAFLPRQSLLKAAERAARALHGEYRQTAPLFLATASVVTRA